MQAARRLFLKQLTWLSFPGTGGTSFAAVKSPVVDESPCLDIDEMYDETNEHYGMEGWL